MPTKINKSERGRWVSRQQRSTEINTIQQSQQKSAKVSKISPGQRAQSAKVSKNHQKSSEIITGLDRSHQKSSIIITNHQSQHVSLWFLNSVQYSSEQTAGIGT
jgi:hypothetical protein